MRRHEHLTEVEEIAIRVRVERLKDGRYLGTSPIDESRTKISAILTTPGDSMLYVYDFGDEWRHEVVLEKILAASDTIGLPVCLAGERHCLPEDVGGTSGYEEFLEVIFEPSHEEFEHYVRWAGGPSALNRSAGPFQPEEFNVMAVNDTLSQMQWPGRHRRAATP